MLQIVGQRSTNEPDRIGVLDQSSRGRQDARHADADRRRAPSAPFEPLDQPGNGRQCPLIVVARCWRTEARENDPVGGQGGCLDFCPTQIDADPGGTDGYRFGHAPVGIPVSGLGYMVPPWGGA